MRVGREAVELLTTGRVTFPLPDADRIRRIKAGEIAYAAVVAEIECLLGEVEAAAAASALPDAPDQDFIDELVMGAYRRQILGRALLDGLVVARRNGAPAAARFADRGDARPARRSRRLA